MHADFGPDRHRGPRTRLRSCSLDLLSDVPLEVSNRPFGLDIFFCKASSFVIGASFLLLSKAATRKSAHPAETTPSLPSLKRFGASDLVDCGGRDDPRAERYRSRDLDHPHRQRWSYVVCRRRLLADYLLTSDKIWRRRMSVCGRSRQHLLFHGPSKQPGVSCKPGNGHVSGISPWAHGRDRSARGLSMARCSPAPACPLRATSTARADIARSASSWAL